MSNKNLFKEAIADAKAVREAALANAKAALEEALTPKLQSMLATKLQEMEYMEEDELEGEVEDLEDEMEEGFTTSHGDDSEENLDFNLEEDEDFDLSEILAELEEEEISEPFTDEEPHMDIKGTERGYVKEAKEEDEEEETEEEESEEEGSEEEEETEEVADMSVEDLKALIKDIVAQEVSGAETEAEEEMIDMSSEEGGAGEEASDEIDLEELLAELDALGEGEEELEERKKSKHEKGETKKQEKEEHTSGKEKAEMKEAIATINHLRTELNEVNLLNAKLLYVNKIFKAKNLSESQKLQVIASFDKATTAKEAKVVFESLNNTLTAAPAKKAIKESLGFASKAAGVAPNKVIVESNDVITRMQKLANIIK